ncbi:MAG: extracellular solute-binding protein [Clostridiales bacterium]|nr:extracellular solute-binding protein [Clostridiales bacterium]
MKKKVLSIMLVGALAFSMAACGSSSDSETTTDDTTSAAAETDDTSAEAESAETSDTDSDGRTVITLFRSDDGNGAIEAAIEAFEASQDEYSVEWVVASSDTDENRNILNTALSAGSSEYDVMAIDTCWAGDMAAAGYIEPLDSYMQEAGRTQAEYNAGSLQAGTYNAKTYALPLYPDFGVLYFRSDIVSEEDAATLISGDYTWADLQAMAEAYMGEGGTTYGITFQAPQAEGLVCNANEYTANFTDIEGGLQAMKNMVDSAATPDDILIYQESETLTSYVNGETVFARNWPYQWGNLTDDSTVTQDQTEVAPLPGGSCIGGWLLAINANSENKEGAWALLDYLTAGEGQQIFCSVGGYVPGYNAYLEDADVLEANQLLTKEGFLNALENTIARPSSDNYDELSDALQISIHTYLSGEADLDTTVAEVEALLAEE